MKKKIASLALVLVIAMSMTVGASAAYIPDDVTYQNLNGQQLAIKTYTLLPDQDPSDLYEEDFEYDGFLYSMTDIVKQEQTYPDVYDEFVEQSESRIFKVVKSAIA